MDPAGGVGASANGKKKRCVRREVFGSIVSATAHRKWSVRFDHDGVLRKVASGATI